MAPVGWVRAVLRYAKSQIPARKIILGIPLYGYDWSGGHGTGGELAAAPSGWPGRTTRSRVTTPPARQPWFGYTDAAGRRHTVWFENAASSRAKFGAGQGAGIGGVYLWMFGYEDTGTWYRAGATSCPSSSARGPDPARSRGGAWPC